MSTDRKPLITRNTKSTEIIVVFAAIGFFVGYGLSGSLQAAMLGAGISMFVLVLLLAVAK